MIKTKDIDRQNQIIKEKFECVSEENIFSIPRSKRFLYLNDEAKVLIVNYKDIVQEIKLYTIFHRILKK